MTRERARVCIVPFLFSLYVTYILLWITRIAPADVCARMSVLQVSAWVYNPYIFQSICSHVYACIFANTCTDAQTIIRQFVSSPDSLQRSLPYMGGNDWHNWYLLFLYTDSLHQAVTSNDFSFVKWALENGKHLVSHLNEPQPDTGMTPVMIAAQKGFPYDLNVWRQKINLETELLVSHFSNNGILVGLLFIPWPFICLSVCWYFLFYFAGGLWQSFWHQCGSIDLPRASCWIDHWLSKG